MSYNMEIKESSFFVPTEHTGRVFALTETTGYSFHLNENGDIVEIEYDGCKLGNDFEMFQKIAPFVRNGSYLEMLGEDGTLWRWIFKRGKCKEILPKISWPDDQ